MDWITNLIAVWRYYFSKEAIDARQRSEEVEGYWIELQAHIQQQEDKAR